MSCSCGGTGVEGQRSQNPASIYRVFSIATVRTDRTVFGQPTAVDLRIVKFSRKSGGVDRARTRDLWRDRTWFTARRLRLIGFAPKRPRFIGLNRLSGVRLEL